MQRLESRPSMDGMQWVKCMNIPKKCEHRGGDARHSYLISPNRVWYRKVFCGWGGSYDFSHYEKLVKIKS